MPLCIIKQTIIMDIAEKRIKEWANKNDEFVQLDLSGLSLTQLPDIPPTCVSMDCSFNKLTTLPYGLQCRNIRANNNNLLYLPPLEHLSLVNLHENDYLHVSIKQYKTIYDWFGLDRRVVNYPRFVTKIQKAYRVHKQRKTFLKLAGFYNKYMAKVISEYI